MRHKRSEALSLYYSKVQEYPVLSAEQEVDLARRVRDQGDREAFDILVLSNMRAVIKIAGEYRRQHASFSDLIQEGMVGLMKAVERYDPERGTRFLSYAAWWIRATIRDHLLRTRSLVRLGTTQRQRTVYSRLGKARAQVEREGLRGDAAAERLAELIGVDRATVESMQGRLAGYDLSLDAPVGTDESSSSRSNFIPDQRLGPEDLLGVVQEADLQRRALVDALGELPEREQEIIMRRHLVEAPETLQQVGDRLGISRERVRQLEVRALRRIKDWVANQAPLDLQVA